MDRFEGSSRLMVVSDLDCTMVDHDDPVSLLRFNALWEVYYGKDFLLVFSSGRSPASYLKLRNKKPLLTPDITISSVGTKIMYVEAMVRDDYWEEYLNQKWDKQIVMEETSRAYSSEVKLLFSNGTALDVLPKGAGKGKALAYLLKKIQLDGKVPVNTLVCGDSGNDADLYSVPEVYGVMEELLQWRNENAKSNTNIVHATERCAAGIMQAIGHFGLGPNVSPRDIRDFEKCKLENFSPAHEVVKFYLFYERWRRAEVAKSEDYMQNLKLVFVSMITFFSFGNEKLNQLLHSIREQ